jgi:hypothetical protein
LKLAVAGGYKIVGPPKLLNDLPLKIPAGGTATVRFAAPAIPFSNKARFELSNAPEGITIKRVSPIRDGGEIVLQCDAKVKPGRKGTLTVTTPVGNTSLPTVPFEITGK